MARPNSLLRNQTGALLMRTLHWQRRQYCTLICNLIVPPALLIVFAVLSRAIQPPAFTSLPYEQAPKGGYAPRPFDPSACLKAAANPRKNVTLDTCMSNLFVPRYIVPIHAPTTLSDAIGSRKARDPQGGSGFLSALSLDPFVYPAAINPASPFFGNQTSYDGVFLHSFFNGDRNDSTYKTIAAVVRARAVDFAYDAETVNVATRSDLLTTLYDSWFSGGAFHTYSTALSFNTYSQPDGIRDGEATTAQNRSLSLSATIFYNESSPTSCSDFCPLVSNVARVYGAIYPQVMANKSAMAYLRRMPNVNPFESLNIIQLFISILIAQLTHFLLPSFLRFLVLERVGRMRSLMASMGLGRTRYWLGTYLSLLALYLTSAVIIVVVGLATRIPFFVDNTPVSYLVLFFIWGNVLVAFAMFLEPFFASPETAQIFGWFFIIIINLVGAPYIGRRLSDENTSEGTWAAIMLLPSFAYMRSIYFAGAFNSGGQGLTLTPSEYRDVQLGMCHGEGPFCRSYAFLAVEWFFLIAASMYLDRVFSRGVGSRAHPLFFLGFKRRFAMPSDVVDTTTVDDVGHAAEVHPDDTRGEDVKEEELRARQVVQSLGTSEFDGVVLHKLSKSFPGKPAVHAVQNVSLVARRNDIVCILAHNGAGKTTMFRTLVGELEATSGNAYVNGHSIQTDMESVQRKLGVAAQQNILWDVLSVREHLYFYGRVKNLCGRELRSAVDSAMDSVQLAFAHKRKVRMLSGGMKRRLSVSIAMMGNADFIILDEPSTGLDLVARQKLWEAIERMRKDKVVLLTTHSLEEAEALSTRVAIMSHGVLKCIGTADDLKLRLGKGHRLTVSLPASRMAELRTAVMRVAPDACVETVVGGNVEYVLPRRFPMSAVFALMAEKREELQISDWSINQSSLEDVFLKVTRDGRSEAVKTQGVESV